MPTRSTSPDEGERQAGTEAGRVELSPDSIALRKEIDAELDAAFKSGGATPHDEFFAELRARYGG